MDVADNLAVLRDGRIEQVGAPRDIYEAPANEFVMSFIGPVAEVDGRLVRPHDLRLFDRPQEGAQEAMVLRVVHLGFQVRVELVRGGGEEVTALITRPEADALELRAGEIVWLGAPALLSA